MRDARSRSSSAPPPRRCARSPSARTSTSPTAPSRPAAAGTRVRLPLPARDLARRGGAGARRRRLDGAASCAITTTRCTRARAARRDGARHLRGASSRRASRRWARGAWPASPPISPRCSTSAIAARATSISTERNDVTLAEAIRLLAREALDRRAAAARGAARGRHVAPVPRRQVGRDLQELDAPCRQPGRLRQGGAPADPDLDLDLGETEQNPRPTTPRAKATKPTEREPERRRRGRGLRRAGRARRRRRPSDQRGRRPGRRRRGGRGRDDARLRRRGSRPPRPARHAAAPRPQRRSRALSRLHAPNATRSSRPTQLCDAEELARLRNLLDQQLAHLQGVIARSPTACSAA